ncbi:hypothetical protein VTO42DRAFT_7331 [Malbranchea cinnamomea]
MDEEEVLFERRNYPLHADTSVPQQQNDNLDQRPNSGEDREKVEQGPESPLTEQAFAPVLAHQLEEEQDRRQRAEERFERARISGGPVAALSEVSIPPPAERRPPRPPEPWATLESAESRVSTASVDVQPAVSVFVTQLFTVSHLIFFSILGALARIGLQALTVYPGAPVVTGVLWPNVGGSLLMGFFAEDRNVFREEWGLRHPSKVSTDTANRPSLRDSHVLTAEESLKRHRAVKKTIPLYIGLTTGFCGSFTSFSTFILDVFLALSNDLENPNTPHITPRNGGYSLMAVIAVILYTVSLSLSALMFGAHLAAGLDRHTPTLPFNFVRKVLDPGIVVLGIGCWLGSIFLALWPPDRHLGMDEFWRGRAVFAVVFAPLGVLLRYYISLALNTRIPSFPLGTFAVNIIGTAILGMCFDLQHARNIVGINRLTGCQVLNGVMDGFCGCATTVSTWVAELHSLELRHAYRYGLVSIGVALAMLVVIIGSMRWTAGLDVPVC